MDSKRVPRLVALLAMVAMFLVAPAAFAQSSKGILVGNVTDPTGAVISGATVKVTNLATNVTRETVASEAGTYRLDAVDPGTYKIEVIAAGFKTSQIDGVIVSAGQTTSTIVKLDVGTQGEIINVTSETTVTLQTQDGSRTSTIDTRQISEIPVSDLNPVNLVFTLPGVTSPGVLAGGFAQGAEFNINGLRARANNQLVDGTDNNDNSITGQSLLPSLRDGYQEVSVLGGNNSAEYGRGGGAVVNLITKGGTNQFHGSVYNLINTSSLSSLTSGQKNNQGLTGVPVSIQNQPGFSFGGPIVKDKLFFFGTYQATLFRSSSGTASAVVPTAAGFAQLRQLFPAGRSANLDRYLSIVGNLRGTVNPFQAQLGGNRPAIEFGTATLGGLSTPSDTHQFLTRVDWVPTDRDNVSFRYLFNDQTVTNQIPSAFAGFGIDVPSRSQNFLLTHTHTFSPTLTNEFRFAYGRTNVAFTPQDPATLVGPQFAFGGTNISTVGLNATFPQGRTFNNFQYQDTLTYIVGNHTLRLGVDLLRQTARQAVPFNNRGTLTFSAGGGFPTFGNFVDGFSGSQGVFGAIVFGSPVIYPNAFQQSYFINDSWRVKPNLTVNLGLRYENYGTPYNVARFPAFAGFDVPLDTVAKQKSDNNNFAPRVSFAYTPRFAKMLFGEDKTVFRGGYALSYDVFFNNILSNTAAASPNAFGATLLGGTGRGLTNAGVTTLPTTGAPNPQTGITTIDRNLVNPMTHVWNFGVQRELPGNLIVDVAYVGSRGQRLFINEQLNPGVPGTTNANRRLFASRGPITARTNGGDSIYHSLQTRVERGFKNGLFVRYAYTYSKAIDNVNSEVFVTSGGSSVQSDPFNRSKDRSLASFDAPHRHIWTFVYNLPGPKNGLMYQVAGGWQLSGTYRLQSGAVETPFVGGIDLNGDLSGFNDRPAISNPNAPANSVAILASLLGIPGGGYVDANGDPIARGNARYIVDPAIRTNIAGRNTLRAERTNFLDLAVTKGFKMPFEGHRFELRFEVFNLFNQANFTWANPGLSSDVSNGDVTNPFFNNVRLNDGGVNGTSGNRIARIQLRYTF